MTHPVHLPVPAQPDASPSWLPERSDSRWQ